MAEIKIEKKKPVWPWIILVLVILAIVAYLVYENQDRDDLNDDFDDGVTDGQVMDSTNDPINDPDTYNANNSYSSYDGYMAYEQSISDSTRIAIDSSYTKKAFSNLTKVVVSKAEENNLEDSDALTDLRNYTTLNTNISKGDTGMENYKNFKTASDKIAKVLEDIQSKSYPNLQSQVADLKQVASNIDGSIAMDKQQAAINSFLKACRRVLQLMND